MHVRRTEDNNWWFIKISEARSIWFGCLKIGCKITIKVIGPRRAVIAACPGRGSVVGQCLGEVENSEEDTRQSNATDAIAASVEAAVDVQKVEIEVDEVKMEAEDHLAREYVREFVLDHLDPADVKREVSLILTPP